MVAVLLGNVCSRTAVEILAGKKKPHDFLAHNPVSLFPRDKIWAHRIDANSEASSSGLTAREWSSLTSPQVENDQIMYLAFPSPTAPLHTHRHTPGIPDFAGQVFLGAHCRSRRSRKGNKAEPGPFWLPSLFIHHLT